MKRYLLLHGPNLNMLGTREPEVYGRTTLADLERRVIEHAEKAGVHLDCFQSNHEGALVDRIHAAQGVYDGIVYNPGAHTHYSYAIRDAIGSVDVPVVEVHISDVDAREPFRSVSVVAPACVAQIKGKGIDGYLEAVDGLLEGWNHRLGEGFEHRQSGKTIVGGEERTHDACAPGGKDAESPLPFDAAVVESRLGCLREELSARGLDAAVLRGTSDIQWATGFDGVFDDEQCHALLLTAKEALLHTDSRYSSACREAASGLPVRVDDSRRSHAAFAKSALESCDAGRIRAGIEDSVSVREFRQFEDEACGACGFDLVLGSPIAVRARSVKDAGEILRMKAAQAITDAAFDHIVSYMRPGMTEKEIQIELESFMLRNGAEGLAFSSIVATGANGANPHAIPGETVLEPGQCVVLDFGAKAFGYCSDMTRTVFLGAPEGRMLEAWETMKRANESVEASLKAGVSGAEMHELAEKVLADGGFAGLMGHGLGHGVGIDVHEEPTLSPRNADPLPVGAVVTVEPGIYIPGDFGMRLEDFGVVTEDGFEVFTKSTHDIVII